MKCWEQGSGISFKFTHQRSLQPARRGRWARAVLALTLPLLLLLPVMAKDKVAILNTGNQPGHYLQWDGTPIMPIADSLTQGWQEHGTNFNQNAYIDALSAEGVNMSMIWSYVGTDSAGQIADNRIGYDAPEIWPWQGSTDSNSMNLNSLNQNYFNRMKDFVSYAESKDILVLLTVHDGGPKWRWGRHPFDETQGNGPLTNNSEYVALHDYNNEVLHETFSSGWSDQKKNQYYQETFVDKLITELEPYSNVIYEMFNEGEWYNQTNRRRHEEHFLEFFDDRTDTLLMTNTDHITGDDPHGNPNVDIPSFHEHSWTGHFGTYQSAFNHSTAKPHFMSESLPEFNDDAASPSIDTIRQSAWEISMAGAGWGAQNNTSFGWDPNTIMAGHATARDQLYDQIGNVAKFYNDLGVEFWNMAPNGALASTGVATANVDSEYLIYANSGGNFTVNLAATAGATMNVNWYNPRSGVLTPAADVDGGSSSTSFSAPDGNDWVLWLKAEGSSPTTGDFDEDGDVDGHDFLKWQRGESTNSGSAADLVLWESNFGASANAVSATTGAVPEPSTLMILTLASFIGLLFRRDSKSIARDPSVILSD